MKGDVVMAWHVLMMMRRWGWVQRPQLVKGNMQLFSVDQQRSQALEAHAAVFAQFKVRNPNYSLSPVHSMMKPSWYLYLCFHSTEGDEALRAQKGEKRLRFKCEMQIAHDLDITIRHSRQQASKAMAVHDAIIPRVKV